MIAKCLLMKNRRKMGMRAPGINVVSYERVRSKSGGEGYGQDGDFGPFLVYFTLLICVPLSKPLATFL